MTLKLKKLKETYKQLSRFLDKESRGIDYLVLWLDCDKEGENICFEVLDIVEQNIRVGFIFF